MRRMGGRRRPVLAAVAAASLVAFAACSGGGGGGGGSPSEPGSGLVLLVLSSDTTSIPTSGLAHLTVVAMRDGAPAPAVTVLLSTTLGQLDAMQLLTDGQGHAATLLHGGSTTGTARVTAQVQGQVETTTLDVRIGLDRFLAVQAQPATIAGSQVSTLGALLVEGTGAPVSGAVVSFSTSLGTLDTTHVVTDGRGSATTTLRSDGHFGPALVTANVSGVAPASTLVTIQPTYVISLVASPLQITASGRATISIAVVALDPLAPVGHLQLQVVSSLGRVETPVRTDAAGQASTTLTADGRTGTATVTVTLQGGAALPAIVAVDIQ
jgi:hypothetical protein